MESVVAWSFPFYCNRAIAESMLLISIQKAFNRVSTTISSF